MSRLPAVPAPATPVPARRAEAGPWAIELLPGAAYETRYVAAQAAIGFAFDSQRGVHAIGSDRLQPFLATPNGLAFVPAGCDVYSQSAEGGEYLRLVRTDGAPLVGMHACNNRIDPQAIALARRLRNALLAPKPADDCEAWALALAERATLGQVPHCLPGGSMTAARLRLLDDFIEAGLDGPLSLTAMAALLGLSEGFFLRAFKQAVGTSPHRYVIDRRLARARRLMRSPSLRLADIAQACGFASQAHMATAFKQRLGLSPSALRLLP
ncbi:AraC family transcriptional regulator [Pseudomonas sp. M47T1]|uniref:helix-turn-helix transcriptional regulator n=1 Tax=Pseudomonas sp. M47T1 TaxID=1179778 RepID=UPI0002608AFD|nr:AraC family transcriptional regulator [Pseudomonas sp. M47T1]